jgi:hypothetical protein
MGVAGRVVLVAVARGGERVARGRLETTPDADLATIDLLARWALALRRAGCTLEIRQAGSDLAGLLELTGLRDVVASVVEVVGEAEGGEQLPVDEVVVADDPVA